MMSSPAPLPSGVRLDIDNHKQAADIHKDVFSHIEKTLNSMISRVDKVVLEGRGKEINSFLIDSNSLRLHMRLVRRWRNGSMVCTEDNLACVKEFLIQARLRLLKIEEEVIRAKIDSTDEYMLILDDKSNRLRDILEGELNALDPDYSSLEYISEDLSKREEKVRWIHAKADDLLNDVLALRGHQERIVDGSSIQLSFVKMGISVTSNGVPFEHNPERNNALALVDKIKMTIRLLREGYHRRMSDQTKEDVERCAEKDVEGLRRQLRKVRRWQQNEISFNKDDVLDLQLIINALIKHLGREGRQLIAPETNRLRSWRSMSSIATMDLSHSTKWRPTLTLAASSMDISAADSAYASSPSSESDVPLRLKKNINKTRKIPKIKEQEDVQVEKDSLDEDSTYSERLI